MQLLNCTVAFTLRIYSSEKIFKNYKTGIDKMDLLWYTRKVSAKDSRWRFFRGNPAEVKEDEYFRLLKAARLCIGGVPFLFMPFGSEESFYFIRR